MGGFGLAAPFKSVAQAANWMAAISWQGVAGLELMPQREHLRSLGLACFWIKGFDVSGYKAGGAKRVFSTGLREPPLLHVPAIEQSMRSRQHDALLLNPVCVFEDAGLRVGHRSQAFCTPRPRWRIQPRDQVVSRNRHVHLAFWRLLRGVSNRKYLHSKPSVEAIYHMSSSHRMGQVDASDMGA